MSNALIGLHRCTGWSVSLFFICNKLGFSQIEAIFNSDNQVWIYSPKAFEEVLNEQQRLIHTVSLVRDFVARRRRGGIISRGTKVANFAKTQKKCTRKIYDWNFVCC